MFLLGHLGLTAAAWSVAMRRWPLGWLLLGAILPDLVDKPVGLLAGNGYGRLLAHTLLFAGALLLAALLLRRAWLAALAAGVVGHLALDRLWEVPQVLLWPLLGSFPHETWTVERYATLVVHSGHVLAFEILGAAALALVLLLRRRKGVPTA